LRELQGKPPQVRSAVPAQVRLYDQDSIHVVRRSVRDRLRHEDCNLLSMINAVGEV
jgi:hypothetical protein